MTLQAELNEPLSYVRNHYGVPAHIARRVKVAGKPGIIVKDLGHYIGVHFDGHPATHYLACHPTWKVEYLEMGELPKLTAGQRRYQDYLEVADCYENFGDFLKARGR